LKTNSRRSAVTRLGAVALYPWFSLPALAEGSSQVKIIVPYPPGAATDAIARLIAVALQERSNVTHIIDNRGGGATQIGTKAIAMAAPDGKTLGFIDTSFVINPGLFGARLPYNTKADFQPLSETARAPLVLLVHKSVPAADLKELIALARQRPGTLSFGSAGIGSAPHLAGEQLKQAASIDITHVPYRGGSSVLTDLIGGQVQLGFTTVPTMIEHIHSGAVRALAVCGSERAAQIPVVPTMAQLGYPEVNAVPLFGLIAPGRLDPEQVRKIGEVAANAAKAGPLNKRLLDMGFVPIGSSPDEFRKRIDVEVAKWSEVIKRGKIQPIG
jgi:tripartite-type tricarboxylate transporter receptor subunit TctC